jgi:hypothetical protein
MCKPRSTFAERIDAPGARVLQPVTQIAWPAVERGAAHVRLALRSFPAPGGQSR